MSKNRHYIYNICMIALLTAMMVLLKRTIAIETPYFKFSFASLPIVLAALLFGPIEGAVVGLLGEFIRALWAGPHHGALCGPRRHPGGHRGTGGPVVPPGHRPEAGEPSGAVLHRLHPGGGAYHRREYPEHLAGVPDVPHLLRRPPALPAWAVLYRDRHCGGYHHRLYPLGLRPAPQRRGEIHRLRKDAELWNGSCWIKPAM